MNRARPSDRSEAGSTLIELIVATVIMGVAFVTILGGIGTAIISSDAQRRDASTGVVLTSTAEKLAASTVPYTQCAGAADYQDDVPPPPSIRFTVTVVKVAFWDPLSNRFVILSPPSPPPVPPAPPACTPATDNGLQLITLSVTTAAGNRQPRTEVLEVVKQEPAT